ncbi:uncharacterized protein LOC119109323 [Pollicipes pollicipes]|uniref:uncharacterized protein LOC119109323 n=1 Tax=Pollicipes pollicipes TaxID=41117 RepID=UPI001884AAD6|nr:uncharacterized protein LOC119109323 [Pollicipes pollicipes]
MSPRHLTQGNPDHAHQMPGHALPVINQMQLGLGQSRPELNRSHPGLNRSHPGLNHSHPGLAQSHPGLNQSLPAFGPHQNLVVGHMRQASGGQPPLVHPYHHQPSPAGRLAELGYTASPPLTNLTELSCQRAALLHENALVDLYQRLHVLELHQLAAAQQAVLASRPPQQPPPPAAPEKQEDEQLFQLEFAAEQYRRLVAGAERLLRELAGRGALDGEQSGRVQQWMCRKQETDECLRAELAPDEEEELLRLGGGDDGSGQEEEGRRPP